MNSEKQLTNMLVNRPEIERRWLINAPVMPDLEDGLFKYTDIIQVYTLAGRIRWERPLVGKERYVLGVKIGEGMVKQEAERVATKDEFESAIASGGNPRITKRRYNIPYQAGEDKYTIQLDYFYGNNTSVDGHYIAEIEYTSEQYGREFNITPSWFGREITDTISPEGKHPYSNRQLAKNGWPAVI